MGFHRNASIASLFPNNHSPALEPVYFTMGAAYLPPQLGNFGDTEPGLVGHDDTGGVGEHVLQRLDQLLLLCSVHAKLRTRSARGRPIGARGPITTEVTPTAMTPYWPRQVPETRSRTGAGGDVA